MFWLTARVTCSFNPPSVTLGNNTSSVLTIAAGNTTPPGVYALTISATSSSGSGQSFTTITLSVGDFSVSASPPTAAIIAGQSATYGSYAYGTVRVRRHCVADVFHSCCGYRMFTESNISYAGHQSGHVQHDDYEHWGNHGS